MIPAEVFVRGVWKSISWDDDLAWVERVAAQEASGEPLGDFGPIVKEMLAKGVRSETIARFATIIGYETAFGVCYHLEDPSASFKGFTDDIDEIKWGLFRVDPETDEPINRICCVHEFMLAMDPSGREMRPKNI